MENKEILEIYGISIESYKKSRAEKMEKNILSYSQKAESFKCKQLQKKGYIITISYSVVQMKYRKVAIYRNEIFCFTTLETIYFDGNVIDLKHAKKETFKNVIQKSKNNLNYHLKNL